MEYLRRYIVFESTLADFGGSIEDQKFPPGGEIHAKSMARHFSHLGVMTSNVDLLECFGWNFVIRVYGVSFWFVLQRYSDEWLVLYEWGLFANLFRRRSVTRAIQVIEEAAQSWHPDNGHITNLRFYSRNEFRKYNSRFRGQCSA